MNDTGTAGVIARPPLLYVAALLLGLAADHLLPLAFDIPKAGLVHWTIAPDSDHAVAAGSELG